MEDAVNETEVEDFEYDGEPLATSQHLDASALTPGFAYEGFLAFLNSISDDGAGGFGAEGYIEHASELQFNFHQLQVNVPNEFVGAWTFGDTTAEESGVVVLLPNGKYVHMEDIWDGDDSANDGLEVGNYSISESGVLTVDIEVDTNGEVGLSHPNGTMMVSVEGDELLFSDNGFSVTLNRVGFDPDNPIQGAWRLCDNDDGIFTGVVVLLPNGVYFQGQLDNGEPFPSASGIERGTYTFNKTTGDLLGFPVVDTNLGLGLSDPIIGKNIVSIVGNTSARAFEGETAHFHRISNAQIKPNWRINKSRNFSLTADTESDFHDVWVALETLNPGDAESVTISGGGLGAPRELNFEDGEEWNYEKDFPDLASLNAEFPDNQTYNIVVSGGELGTRVQTLNIGGGGFPPVPYLTGTSLSDAQYIDSTSGFNFTWNNPDSSTTQLSFTSEPDENGTEYFYEIDFSGTNTGMTIPAGSLDPSISGFCYLEFARETTNTDGAGGFGVSGFSGRQSITFDFPFATRALDDGGLGDAAGTAGLAGEDALPASEPFGDSVSNLLKFAFNMDLAGFDNGSLEPGGDSGLPTFELKDDGGETTFELNFIRRVDSPITYIPQRGDSLESFAPMAGTVTVTPIAGGEFERVTIAEPCDPAVVPKCFGRVLVIIP